MADDDIPKQEAPTPQASTQKASTPGKPQGALGDLVKVESMLQLAIAMPAACLIGWLIGTGLDHHFHTTWMAVLGVVLGAIAGFVQIITTASRYLKRGA